MAEVTGMRDNALPYPVYGVPWTLVFPILDADGNMVTGAAATEDAEVSKNGDTFTNATNAIVEIDTTSGMYYLILTGTEMTADIVAVIAKAGGTAKTTPMVMYPRKLVTLRTGTAQGGAAGYITLDANAGALNDVWNGCLCVATIDGNVEARIITDYNGSNQQASVTPNWNVTPDSDDTFVIYLPEGMQVPSDSAAEKIADVLLGRNIGGGSNSGRLVKEALYPLRNRITISAGTMTVYAADDSTSSWTASVSTTAGADPITAIDPSGP